MNRNTACCRAIMCFVEDMTMMDQRDYLIYLINQVCDQP